MTGRSPSTSTALSRIMRAHGVTSQHLADRLDLQAHTVNCWRCGNRQIPDEHVLNVLNVLRASGCVVAARDIASDGRLLLGCGTPFDQLTEQAA